MANATLLASDNFASGSLAAGWAALTGFLKSKLVGTGPYYAEPNSLATETGQLWTALTWPNDQISEETLSPNFSDDGSAFAVLYVRGQSAANSGYVANISNGVTGQVAIIKNVAGVQTSLAVVSGLTIAAGDVWSFCAAGSCLSLYQNYKRVAYYYDTTFTSGYPGFAQYASTNLIHCQISAWRGYSCVQQDGIWKKQGIVIPALSAELPSGCQPSSIVLFESGAQILSGNVYKMWFNSGNANVAYAESTDGVNWTRYASNVITGITLPTLLKVGSTYYLYGQATAGSSSFSAYTSTDGVNWSLRSADIGINVGGAGAWDHAFIYIFQPVAVIAGTWYGLYSAGNSTATFTGSIGLATSADGLNWTKYVSNPVLSGAWNSQAIVNVSGVWHMWCEQNQLGRGNATAPGIDPTETVRYQSVDLITWTNPVHSVHNTQLFESANTNTGQCYPGAIINVGGKAYLYTQSSPADGPPTELWQIGLAIAPAPIESIIQFNEDGVQQIATDPFTSGAGDLSANWTLPTGGTKLKIIAGPYVEPTVTSTACQAVYTGASFGVNQYSEITIQALTGTLNQSILAPMVLASTTALTGYEGRIGSPTATSDAAASIWKRVAGVQTQLGPTSTAEPQVGDVWRLSVFTGSDGFPVLSLFQNGFLVLQVQDQVSPITSGNPGILAYSVVAIADAQISLWAGGNANVTPAYATGSGLVMAGGDVSDDEDDWI